MYIISVSIKCVLKMFNDQNLNHTKKLRGTCLVNHPVYNILHYYLLVYIYV